MDNKGSTTCQPAKIPGPFQSTLKGQTEARILTPHYTFKFLVVGDELSTSTLESHGFSNCENLAMMMTECGFRCGNTCDYYRTVTCITSVTETKAYK